MRTGYNPKDYANWRKEMANLRKVCLACEQDEFAKTASAEEMEASQPNADSHEGLYCKKRSGE